MQKIKSFTIHLLLFSLIIYGSFNTVFAFFYFALFQYFHDTLLKFTQNLEVAVQSGGIRHLFWWLSFFFCIAAQMVLKRVLRMHIFAYVLKHFERGPTSKAGTMNRISD